jgi:ABC-type amino acid transport substrate-binding protein
LDRVTFVLFSSEFVKRQETLNFQRKENQINWKDAINKESKEMMQRGFWEIINERTFQLIKYGLKKMDI